ncbi:hypothetical protein [Prevotella disiens]|uniref:hypothetical protein n=1 Tax=Prevotella disiens TaxID=28130 RepID=UPI0012E015CB|nr:hypothetical protein [Prevotella disiens]
MSSCSSVHVVSELRECRSLLLPIPAVGTSLLVGTRVRLGLAWQIRAQKCATHQPYSEDQ